MQKESKIRSGIIYSFFFLLIAFCTFGWFFYYGKTLLVNTDGFDQYYPFMVSVRTMVKELVYHRSFSFWNWNIGLGADNIGSIYMVLFDPFAYIMAAFPPAKMDIGFSVAVIVRLYFAGLAMLIFLRHRKVISSIAIAGALSYCFSSWALCSFFQMFFLLPLIIFPLLILALDIFDEKGNPFWVIVIVAFTLISSLYFAYMSAIMAGLYFLIKGLPGLSDICWKEYLWRFVRMCISLIIAAMIALPIILIVGIYIINAPSAHEEFTLFFPFKDIIKYIPAFITSQQFYGNYSAVSAAALPLAMVPLSIIDLRKTKKIETIMFIGCFFLMASPIAAKVLNGFSYVTSRWGYIMAFFFVWNGVSVIEDVIRASSDWKRRVFNCCAILLCVLMISLIPPVMFGMLNSHQLTIAMINLMFIVVIAAILVISNSKKNSLLIGKRILLSVVCNLCLVGTLTFSTILTGGYSEYMETGKAYEQYSTSLLKNMNHIDEDFYRVGIKEHVAPDGDYVSVYHWASNETLFAKTPSTFSYISTLDSDWADYNKALCNNNGYLVRVQSFANNERTRMDFLEGVRYYVLNGKNKNSVLSEYGYSVDNELTTDKRIVYRTNLDTSLGYVYSNIVKRSEFDNYDYLDREQLLMQAAVIDDEDLSAFSTQELDSPDLVTNNLSYEVVDASDLEMTEGKIIVKNANAKLTLSVDSAENSELFAAFYNLKRIPVPYEEYKKTNLKEDSSRLEKHRFYITNKDYKEKYDFVINFKKDEKTSSVVNQAGVSHQAVNDMEDYLCSIGYFDSINGELVVEFKTAGTYTYDKLELFTIPVSGFEEQAKILSDNRLHVTEYKNDHIKGNIDTNGGVLYLSILNSGGWNVKVDNQKVKVYSVNMGFIGVPVTEGSHTIELDYVPPFFHITKYICLLGCILCLISTILYAKKESSK